MKKGEKMSDEQKQKLSLANMGKKFSPEHIQKLKESHKGKIPSNLEQLRTYRKGRPLSEEHKDKIRKAQIGKSKNLSPESRLKMSECKKGKPTWNAGTSKKHEIICKMCLQSFFANKMKKFCSRKCWTQYNQGENNYRWIENREKVVGRHTRNAHDPSLKQWRKIVFKRDNFTCKVKNESCCGKIEAHHILRWSEHEELRYKPDNGITLCHYHHPRNKKDEIKNIELYKSLIS